MNLFCLTVDKVDFSIVCTNIDYRATEAFCNANLTIFTDYDVVISFRIMQNQRIWQNQPVPGIKPRQIANTLYAY